MKASLFIIGRGIVAVAVALSSAPSAHAQLWKEFAHTDEPHIWSYPNIPISIPDLINDANQVIQLPVLVVLMEFSDLAHQPFHPPDFFEDLVFGNGAGPWTAVRPSVRQIIEASSNGRILLVPANETYGPNDDPDAVDHDGIVGWVTAQCPPGVQPPPPCDTFASYGCQGDDCTPIQRKRAEAIRRADPFIDYSSYDTLHPDWSQGPDGFITSNELVVILVNADDVCEDQHDAVNHPDPGIINCAGGNCRPTEPAQVLVDGVLVQQNMAAVIEGAHANVLGHELGHQILGLRDLYGSPPCNPGLSAEVGNICYQCAGGACNDACMDAACLDDGAVVGRPGHLVALGSTDGSTGTDVSGCSYNDTIDVWFTYTPAFTDNVTISLCILGCTQATAKMDTTLAVFDGCNGNQLSGACNDDFDCDGDGQVSGDCDRLSQLTVAMTAATTYWIRISGYNAVTGPYQVRLQGGGGTCSRPVDSKWFPVLPSVYSLMASDPDGYLTHLDPWAKIHLGFVKPLVVTHDGTYTLHDAETIRSFAQQDAQREALVIYDPLRPDRYKEYFILENRDVSTVPAVNPPATFDRGLAVWLINENPVPGETSIHPHRVIRLIRQGGHRAPDTQALWDGSDPSYYDLTPTSSPRNTNWTDGSASYVEIYDISPAGPVMTLKVRMPPIFVDQSNAGSQDGSQENPFATAAGGIDAIPEPPRTIRIAGGFYPEPMVIETPCTLAGWRNGDAIIGQ